MSTNMEYLKILKRLYTDKESEQASNKKTFEEIKLINRGKEYV